MHTKILIVLGMCLWGAACSLLPPDWAGSSPIPVPRNSVVETSVARGTPTPSPQAGPPSSRSASGTPVESVRETPKNAELPTGPTFGVDGSGGAQTPMAEGLLHALLALGIDYRRGGNSPSTGFDCSGLVAHVFREAYGLRLPRDARGQSTVGLSVEPRELRPGDLVFYNTRGRPFSHVGIYLGDERFLHAPRAGARVRIESMRVGYWVRRYNGARRIEPGRAS